MPDRLRLVGGRLAARRWGDGRGGLVLCWHGAGGSSDDFADAAERLVADGLAVLAVDGPGHGTSPPALEEGMRPSSLARLAADALDEVGAGEVVFAGFSWGATVGCWFGALFPERTRGLILIEGGHVDFADLPDFREPHRGTAVEASAVEAAMISGACAEPAAAAYERLATAKVPVLFVGRPLSARAVEALGFDPLERLRARVPQTQVVTLDGDDHEFLRSDADRVAQTASAWVRSLDRG